MRSIRILMICVDLFYLGILSVAVFMVFGALGMISYLATGGDFEPSSIVTFVLILCLALFAYAIHLVREAIAQFTKGEFFNETVVRNFRKSGIVVLFAVALVLVLPFGFAEADELARAINAFMLFPFAILGLFLLALSTIFNNAKHLKEENDLTL